MKSFYIKKLGLPLFLWITLVLGCSKTEPCKNGECCWPNETSRLVKQIEGSQVGLLGSNFLFKDELIGSGNNSSRSCQICPSQVEGLTAMKLEDNLKNNVHYEANGNFNLVDSSRAYPYQVWGSLYLLTSKANTFAPQYVFYLEKIEKLTK